MKSFTAIILTFCLLLIHSNGQMNTCSLSSIRTSRGITVQCRCPGVHTTRVRLQLSVNVEVPCIKNCYLQNTDVIDACNTGSGEFFQAVDRAGQRCCPSCGGNLNGRMCTRVFLPSRPIPIPASGCNNKIREVPKGLSYQCKCAPSTTIDVDVNIASGVDDDCILACSRGRPTTVCNDHSNVGDIRRGLLNIFEGCCARCAARGNVILDGGYTCGFKV